MTVIKPNYSRLPRERYYCTCQVITPLSENKAFRDVQTNCRGVTAMEPPFEVGGWDSGVGFMFPLNPQ